MPPPVVLPQVALEFMNRDHAEFVTLRDRLLDLMATRIGDDEVNQLLSELIEHTRRHFADEEQAMRDTGFPPYEVHKNEHDRVLAEMAYQVERWRRGGNADSLRDWVERAVGDWLVGHVGSMDMVTASYIAARRGG